jgi:hypothetical protein
MKNPGRRIWCPGKLIREDYSLTELRFLTRELLLFFERSTRRLQKQLVPDANRESNAPKR